MVNPARRGSNETTFFVSGGVDSTVAGLSDAALAARTADLRGPLAIVMGSEQYGLSEFWLKHADLPVRIPMAGQADSLNVAMATTLLRWFSPNRIGRSTRR